MNKPAVFIRYLDNLKNMSSYIDDNRRLSAQNKIILDSLIIRSPKGLSSWLDKQLKTYGENGKGLNEIYQKHVIASSTVRQYPNIREKFFSDEKNLDAINLPVIISIAVLSGSIMTLYDSISFKIKLQNKYLLDVTNALDKVNSGLMTEADLQTYVNSLKDYVYQPPINIGGAVLMGGLIFGAFYYFTKSEKVKKLLKAVI